jgi:tetratricopeptide (TPR) repeat protein
MRRSLSLLVILTLVAAVVCGCGAKRSHDPQARLDAEVEQYGQAEALARANERVQKDPSAANYDLLGRACAKVGKKNAAREAMEKAVSLDPSYAPSALLLARLLMEEGKAPAAEAMIRRILQKDPASPDGVELLSRLLMSENRANEAEPLVAGALKRHGDSAALHWAYADVLTIQKRYDDAEKEYQRAIRIEPKQVRIRMAFAQMLLFARKMEEAAAQAREVARLDHESAEVQFAAASILHQSGHADEALPLYREALIINPSMLPAANNLAQLLADEGTDTGTGLAWARKAAAIAPHNPAVLDTLGWALVRDGNFEQGLPLLRAVYSKWSANPAIQYHLGWALVKNGQKAEGMQLLQRAAASDRPDTVDQAKKAIAEFS